MNIGGAWNLGCIKVYSTHYDNSHMLSDQVEEQNYPRNHRDENRSGLGQAELGLGHRN